MKLLNFLMPFKTYIMAGAFLASALTAGGFYIRKKLKEKNYRDKVRIEKSESEDCFMRAESYSEIQFCYNQIN